MAHNQTDAKRARKATAETEKTVDSSLPFAAAAAFKTPDGSAAVTAASPGEIAQTQTAIAMSSDGVVSTTVVTTTTVTTTTTTTTTTRTYLTGEMAPVAAQQLQAPVIEASIAAEATPEPAVQVMEGAAATESVPATQTAEATYTKSLGYRFFKRLFDILVSAGVIVVGFIPGLILSIAIMIGTKGSPFYVQKRVMKGGKEFNILKFRTMVVDADNLEKHLSPEQIQEWHTEHKVTDDPRITKLGQFLRRTSIDEFPNFLNVFVGQLSVVGPRAITKEELVWFGEDVEKLLSVPAGVTGWWQVSSRNEATFESGERQKLELYYIDHASCGFDLRIFFKTFTAVFGKTGK